MSQRDSGYARKERDCYETPEWVTEALIPHLPPDLYIWEPACGSRKMVEALRARGHRVVGSDIDGGYDFFRIETCQSYDAIVTNPPYETAVGFIEHALDLMGKYDGRVAMLLRTDFDHAASRSHLFGKNSTFAKKIVLTKRIRWFEESKGSPSFNHAWFIWDWTHEGPPTLAYGPLAEEIK